MFFSREKKKAWLGKKQNLTKQTQIIFSAHMVTIARPQGRSQLFFFGLSSSPSSPHL
jgi:hypothetical protein